MVRLQYMGLVLRVHGLHTHSTWALYSEYKAHVLSSADSVWPAFQLFYALKVIRLKAVLQQQAQKENPARH